MQGICQDLAAEYNELDALVANLKPEEWQQQTPFFGWSIKDEISHIAYFDGTGKLATISRESFMADMESMVVQMSPEESMFDTINAMGGKMSIEELLSSWRENRTALVNALSAMDSKARLPWYGPDMSARSFATARLMETWAHGQDVFDTLKVRRVPTDRIKHIAHLGVTTMGWSFINRKLEAPSSPVKVELTSPSGEIWSWGAADALDSVKGDAFEFCLVVTQRRNIADTNLTIEGETANAWMKIAQAFAGPAEDPPKPGQRVVIFD